MDLESELLELTELAFQAALEPQLWSAVLEKVGRAVKADKGIMLIARPDDPFELPVWRFTREEVRLYFQTFESLNPLQAALDRQRLSGERRDVVRTDISLAPKQALVGSSFYERFMQPADLYSFLLVPLANGERKIPTINLARPRRMGEFDDAEVRVAEALQRPLSAAARLSLRLQLERQVYEGLTAYVSRLPGAVMLVDGRGRVLYANPAAEAVLGAGDGLVSRPEGLRGCTPDSSRRLAALIADAAAGGPGGTFAAPRPSGLRALGVQVAPLRADAGGPRLALVSISDPELAVVAPHERLRVLFGFSPGEARVAAELVAGHDLKAIAERLGVSHNTVRVQLAHALAKTETSRQSQLISLIIRTLARLGQA